MQLASPGHQNSLDILIKVSKTIVLSFVLDHFLDRFVDFSVLIVRFGCVIPLDCRDDSGNSTYHE